MSEIILDFVSKFLLLLIGWRFTQHMVHRYQKDKDVKETRERLLDLHTEVKRNLLRVFKYWNVLVNEMIPLEPSDETENYQLETEIPDIIEEAFIEFQLAMSQLFGRLLVYFKLTPRDEKLIVDLEKKSFQVAELIDKAIDTGELTKNTRKEGFKLVVGFSILIGIIVSAKPK